MRATGARANRVWSGAPARQRALDRRSLGGGWRASARSSERLRAPAHDPMRARKALADVHAPPRDLEAAWAARRPNAGLAQAGPESSLKGCPLGVMAAESLEEPRPRAPASRHSDLCRAPATRIAARNDVGEADPGQEGDRRAHHSVIRETR